MIAKQATNWPAGNEVLWNMMTGVLLTSADAVLGRDDRAQRLGQAALANELW